MCKRGISHKFLFIVSDTTSKTSTSQFPSYVGESRASNLSTGKIFMVLVFTKSIGRMYQRRSKLIQDQRVLIKQTTNKISINEI